MKNLNTLLTTLGLLVSPCLMAAPAYPGLIKVKQPDGSTISIRLHGNEHHHYATTPDGQLLTLDADGYYRPATPAEAAALTQPATEEGSRSAARRRSHLMGYEPVPSIGDFKGLVILAEYPNMTFAEQNTLEMYKRMMNEEGFSDNGASGSVRDYFLNQSGGLFNPQFDVVGPVMLSHDYGYYGSDTPVQDANLGVMIQEACLLADAKCGVNFNKYDNNGDGYADMVYVIYAGYSQSNGAATNTVWPQMYYLELMGKSTEIDGVTVNCFATGGERLSNSGTEPMGIGLICHEFSHTMGLPDLYDTSTYYPKFLGMGTWSVLATGCYNNNADTPAGYSAAEKYQLGWLTPIVPQGPDTDVRLQSLSHNEALMLANPENADEYFMVECRSKQDVWDSYLPAEGMIVTHIDYSEVLADSNHVNIEAEGYRHYIVSANGSNRSNTDQASLPFPGADNVTSFTVLTTPASICHDGTEINHPITNIRYDGHSVTFDLDQKPQAPALTPASNVAAGTFRCNWERVNDAVYYELEVRNTDNDSTVIYRKIQRNRFTLTDLDDQATYACRVRTQSELAYSDWSEAQLVNIHESLPIEQIHQDEPSGVTPCYDLMGRRVTPRQQQDETQWLIVRNKKTIPILLK